LPTRGEAKAFAVTVTPEPRSFCKYVAVIVVNAPPEHLESAIMRSL
jgi:hypothetical protein